MNYNLIASIFLAISIFYAIQYMCINYSHNEQEINKINEYNTIKDFIKINSYTKYYNDYYVHK